jgi:type VI secretion system secreted protein Hcp
MASDIFVKIGNIPGESFDARHKDEIEVISFTWGLSLAARVTTESGGASGKPTIRELSFVHAIDKATPKLLHACAAGTHLPDATITHRRAGGQQQEFLIVRLSDVQITSVSQGGGSDQSATETVSLAFGTIDFEYRSQKADGSLDAGDHFTYDLTSHQEG